MIFFFSKFCCIFHLSSDLDSDSEGSQHSTQSVHSEKTLLEKLEILTNQGLIQVVKVFLDWLRTNTDIILMCAQVRLQRLLLRPLNIKISGVYLATCNSLFSPQSSQSLWNRLSVLLNLLPDGSKMLEAGELLVECTAQRFIHSVRV